MVAAARVVPAEVLTPATCNTSTIQFLIVCILAGLKGSTFIVRNNESPCSPFLCLWVKDKYFSKCATGHYALSAHSYRITGGTVWPCLSCFTPKAKYKLNFPFASVQVFLWNPQKCNHWPFLLKTVPASWLTWANFKSPGLPHDFSRVSTSAASQVCLFAPKFGGFFACTPFKNRTIVSLEPNCSRPPTP